MLVPTLEFNIGKTFHITMEVLSWTSLLAVIAEVVPAITAMIGLVYWSIMLYRLWKKKG